MGDQFDKYRTSMGKEVVDEFLAKWDQNTSHKIQNNIHVPNAGKRMLLLKKNTQTQI
jgi:peptidyl-tRNA hydrolase